MHLRRSTGLALGALLLAAPAVTACGFNYATDRPNNITAGANDQDGTTDVLGAVIVSAQDGSGTFIASLSNNSPTEEATFDSLAGAEGNTLQPASVTPVRIPAGRLVSLADEGGVPVTGSFSAGDFVPVTVGFDNGESVTLEVPVLPDTGEYAGLDTSAEGGASDGPGGGAPSPSSSPTE
jgi:hypothetical protein